MEELLGRTTVVTYLEMTEPPTATRPWPDGGFRLERLVRPSVRFYRYLYEAVGADWLWVERKFEPDATLKAELDDPLVEVHLLTEGGVPAGYGELDRRCGGEVKIRYFGLVPEAIGRGLGGWFLEQIAARAWRSRPRRVWVHTCDLDHPRALANYRARGFRSYDEQTEPVVRRHD
jgi:GNAT superfamily N-acetyltransferase